MNGDQAVPSDETLSSEPQPAPEAPAPAAAEAAVATPAPEAAAPAEDAEAPKRRVQLNPTLEGEARPVAMFAGTTPAAPPPAEAASAAIADAESAMASLPMSATVPSAPVELPSEKVDLDASLEAELEEARAAAVRYWLLLIDNGIKPQDDPRWLPVGPNKFFED